MIAGRSLEVACHFLTWPCLLYDRALATTPLLVCANKIDLTPHISEHDLIRGASVCCVPSSISCGLTLLPQILTLIISWTTHGLLFRFRPSDKRTSTLLWSGSSARPNSRSCVSQRVSHDVCGAPQRRFVGSRPGACLVVCASASKIYVFDGHSYQCLCELSTDDSSSATKQAQENFAFPRLSFSCCARRRFAATVVGSRSCLCPLHGDLGCIR